MSKFKQPRGLGLLWREANAIAAIAYRDFLKLLRDRARMVSSFVFPMVFIGILGNSLQANLGSAAGYNILVFTFTGVFAQTVYQSTAQGVISLMEDRENDFSQEIFVSPISRYSIIFGKILGETLVALPQGAGDSHFRICHRRAAEWGASRRNASGWIYHRDLWGRVWRDAVIHGEQSPRRRSDFSISLVAAVFHRRHIRADQGAAVLSRNSFAALAVALRGRFDARDYITWVSPNTTGSCSHHRLANLAILGASFALFMVIGTFLFVRSERNR